MYEPVEEIIQRKGFWDQMKFFCHVLLPTTRALRLMDQSRIRVKDVNRIWNALGDHLATALTTENFNPNLKRKIHKIFLGDRAAAHRPVFDAAWALDSENLEQVRKLASGAGTSAEQEEWAQITQNTLIILRTVVRRRKLIEQRVAWQTKAKPKKLKMDDGTVAEFVVDNGALDLQTDEEFMVIEEEYIRYCSGSDEYARAPYGQKSDVFWFAYGTKLKYYVIRILNMACTISDVERLHKTYSGIHTAGRNRLRDDRVDRLSLAKLACREEALDIKPIFDGVLHFETLSPVDEEGLVRWGDMLATAMNATNRTIHEPLVEGSRIDLGGGENSRESETLEGHISEPIAEDGDDDAPTAATDYEQEDTITTTTQPRQAIRISAALRVAASSLGLSEEFFRTAIQRG